MNNEINTGGYVHPTPMVLSPNDGLVPVTAYGDFGGMTLRDWFAGQALQAILTASLQGHCYHKEGRTLGPKDYVKAAYENADAMIAARNQPPKP